MSQKRKPFSQQKIDGFVSTKRPRSDVNKNNFNSSDEECNKAGTIKSVVLKDFMCHSLLEVTFKNNITFITGNNGSGKSAILTALIVGLGGKASCTNRGTNIKKLIKTGRRSGYVEISISNEGDMAYKPDIYGAVIVVRRYFTTTGTGQYKIKSETGQVITSKYRDLCHILVNLNIQVDNPVCVMNQDTSRNFLSTTDTRHQYQLFLKATRLDTLAEEYTVINNNKKKCEVKLNEKQELVRAMQLRIEGLKKKVERHKRICDMKTNLNFVYGEYLWAKARDIEAELQQQRADIEVQVQKHETFKEKASSGDEEVERIQETISALQQQITEIKNQVQVQLVSTKDKKRALQELEENYRKNQRKQEAVERTIQLKTANRNNIEEELAPNEEKRNRIEHEEAERQRRLGEIEEKLAENKDILATSQNDLYQILHSCDAQRWEQTDHQLKAELQNIEEKIRTRMSHLESLQGDRGNKLLLYGRKIPMVVDEINARKKEFTQLPRGPLGQYISVKDQKWALAVEEFLNQSNTFHSFMVDNMRDTTVLKSIFSKFWRVEEFPTIITTKYFFQVFNVAPNLVHVPREDCARMFDNVVVSDPVVTNCIIDNSSLENVLLAPSNEVARQLTYEARNVPRNCHQVVTIEGDMYYPDPDYRTYSGMSNKSRFLQVDVEDKIRQLRDEIETQKRMKTEIFRQRESVMQDHRKQTASKKALEAKIKTLNAQREQLRGQLAELRSAEEQYVPPVDFWKDELAAVNRDIVASNAELDQLKAEAEEIQQLITETKEHLRTIAGSRENMEERIYPLQQEIQDGTMRINELKSSERFNASKMRDLQNQIDAARSKLLEKEAAFQKQIEEASAITEKQETDRSVAVILREIDGMEREIRAVEAQIDSVEKVVEEYEKLQRRYEPLTEHVSYLKDTVKELKLAYDKRKKHYKVTEEYFKTCMKYSFEQVLESRQFKGTMEIDSQQKRLELIVMPAQGSQGHIVTANLSGGERSFSTVAFLYSLWQCVQLPFYFLDEFDVYMDKLNRTRAIQILLDHARKHPTMQFVFLTPQDVSFLVEENGVSVFKLDDPEH